MLVADQLEASSQLLAAGHFAIDLGSDTAALDQRCREILGFEGCDHLARELAAWALTSLHSDDLPDIRETFERALAAGGRLTVRGRLTRESSGPRPEGRTRWLQVNARVRHTGEGTSINGILVDGTDDRLLEERWLRGQKREALGVLAAGIAHDLNNVRGAIIGNAELVQSELKLGRSPAESVGEIQQASRRAGDVLHRLLKFGSAELRTCPSAPRRCKEPSSARRAVLQDGFDDVGAPWYESGAAQGPALAASGG